MGAAGRVAAVGVGGTGVAVAHAFHNPLSCSRALDPEAVPILGAGHIDIVKPERDSDEIVLTIEQFMREAGFQIREAALVESQSSQDVAKS